MKDDWILIQGETWVHFHAGKASRIKPFSRLQRTTRVLVDFVRSHTGVLRFEGPVQYARALIDRSVRREGWVDGASHIILHELIREPGGGQAFFTAVSLDKWQRLMAWVQDQPCQCLVFPVAGLLCQQNGDKTVHVLQAGRHLLALHQVENELVFEDAFAPSDQAEDLEVSAAQLAQNLLSARMPSPEQVVWHTLSANADDTRAEAVAEAFSEKFGTRPERVTAGYFDTEGARMVSSLPQDVSTLTVFQSLNSWPTRLAWISERSAPVAMALIALTAILLGFAGYSAHRHAAEINASIQPLSEQVDQARKQLASAPAADIGDRLRRLEEFVSVLSAGASYAPDKVLADLAEVAHDDIRIHRVYLTHTQRTGYQLQIDGQAQQPEAVRELLRMLRSRGWQVESLKPASRVEGSFSFALAPLGRKA